MNNLLKKFDKQNINYNLLALFISIVIIGFVMLFSSSIIIANKKFGDKYYLIKHQLIVAIIPSITLFLGFAFINYKKYVRKYYLILFVISLLLLILVLIPGIGMIHGGARSWIDIGDFFSFQPAEIMKFALIVFFAVLFEKLGRDIKDFKQGFLCFIIVIAIVGLLLLLQPDLGTLSIVFVVSIVMFFVAGGRKRHILLLLLSAFLALVLFLKLDQFNGGVRTTRIDLFLHPEKYSKQNEGYHINQALIAVGTGGIFGRGIGNSVQKFSYLPEVIADSIFAVIAEELGFILTTGFLLLYFFLLWNMLNVAKNAPDEFSKFFVIGTVTWVGFQVFVNIGAMIRLYPLTGVTLPFVSYGGTSMWMMSAACGVVLNISRYSKPAEKTNFNIQRKSRVIINKE